MTRMPPDVELAPPVKRNAHTVEECDEVLARKPRPAVADAWLDERLSAMRLLADEEART